MAFVTRRINVLFSMAKGGLGDKGFVDTKLTGLRVVARIAFAGNESMNSATLVIFGMPLSTMNKLSTLGLQVMTQGLHEVTVEAGDDINGMYTVFKGNIYAAWMDGSGAPEVSFHVEARGGGALSAKPIEPSSYKGPTDVAEHISIVTKKAGYKFENNGVKVMLSSPYFAGPARNQILAAVKAAGIAWIFDNDTVAIWPVDKSRASGQSGMYVMSKETGMIGYPTWESLGVVVKAEYRSPLAYGKQFRVISDVEPANKVWTAWRTDYELDSELPGGAWFISLYGHLEGAAPVKNI